MNIEQIATFSFNLILLGVLLWLFYGPWQETINAILRSNLFRIRDEIFDIAASGEGVSFDNPSYHEARQILNGMIRHACLFTWPRFLILSIFIRQKQPGRINRLLDQIDDQKARDKIEKLIDEALATVAGTMLLRSPVFMIVFMLASPVLLIQMMMDHNVLKRRYWKLLAFIRPDAEVVSNFPDAYDQPGSAG